MIGGILLLVQAVGFSVLSGIVARNKNLSVWRWRLLGLLFGLFGYLAVKEKRRQSPSGESKPSGIGELEDEYRKKCPACAESIKLQAQVCKHCGHEFSEEEVNDEIRRRFEEEIGVEEDESKEPEEVQDGMYYCERDEITVMPTRDKITCPACGGRLSDAHHTYVEEEERDEEEEQE